MDIAGAITMICRRDGRYPFSAYEWLLTEGLSYTMHRHPDFSKEAPKHLTGREVAEGLRACAQEQFGPLAREVWSHWGIRATRDWGEIVYNLINAGLLQKHDDDRPEDFDKVYDLRDL